MDNSTVDSMCRCCAAEGIFKDIKTSYHWMGEEEVYGDMLRECFDVKLAMIEEGGICEVCITQLRNAVNFKKQVLHTEKKFKRHMESRRFKPTEVKEEVSGDNGNSSDDNDNGGADSEDDEDYVPDFEIPIKTESPEEAKSRKRSAKATTSRAKKSRTDDADKSVHIRDHKSIKKELDVSWEVTIVKAENIANVDDKSKTQTRKLKIKLPQKPDEVSIKRTKIKPSPEIADTSELDKHRYNVRTLLQCSNATPIRTHSIASGYICCFCKAHFSKAADLKTHTIHDHDDETKNKFLQGTTLFSFIVKLDITSLICTICCKTADSLEQLIDHLNNIHYKGLHTDIKSYIACFKLEGEAMKCHICSAEYKSFKFLLEHMNKHSTNFVCDECGAGFINLGQLRYHSDNIHIVGAYKCGTCDKVFPSSKKKYFHERASHSQLTKKRFTNEIVRDFRSKQAEATNAVGNSKV